VAKNEKRRSLKEFLKANGCFLCFIPERAEVEEAKKEGAETRQIVSWLIEDCHYSEEVVVKARGSMGHHFFAHARSAKAPNRSKR